MRLPAGPSLADAVSAILDRGKSRAYWIANFTGVAQQQSDDIAVLIQSARRPGVRFEVTGSDERLRRAGLNPGRRVAYGPGFLAGTLVRVGKIARTDEIEIVVLSDGHSEVALPASSLPLTFTRPDHVRLPNGNIEFWGDDATTGARVRCILSLAAFDALRARLAGSTQPEAIEAIVAMVAPLAARQYTAMHVRDTVFLGLSRVQTAPETRAFATKAHGGSEDPPPWDPPRHRS